MKNKNEELLPYYERARDILDYDADTGIFTRFIKTRNTYEEAGDTCKLVFQLMVIERYS